MPADVHAYMLKALWRELKRKCALGHKNCRKHAPTNINARVYAQISIGMHARKYQLHANINVT